MASPFACSSGQDEAVGTRAAAISTGCNLEHVGEPCDPDPTTLGGECTGVCTLTATSGGFPSATCVALATLSDNDGKICGTPANKRSSCKRTCKSGVCQLESTPGAQAAVGTACKPSDDGSGGFNSTICDGACDASGNCQFLFMDRCPRGTAAGGCALAFCDPLDAKSCKDLPLAKDTTCNDGNACTTADACDGSGKCGGSPTSPGSACPGDGNPCTAEACDGSGKCASTPVTPGTACTSDGDACTVDQCDATGKCAHTARDCDDGDPCTVDSCKSFGAGAGCQHAPKCTGDACNTASCDATTGACSLVPITCTDFDPCTTDTCVLPGGCKFTAIPSCGDAGVDSGPVDTGTPDTGTPDTGTPDTAAPDTGTPDTGKPDTGTITDSAITDTAMPDTAMPDTAMPDTASEPDTAMVDSGTAPDTATEPDTGAIGDSASASDADDDAAVTPDAPVELNSGCGCRTTGTSRSPYALAGLATFALVAFRRRRRA
jgi:MYXO-CTERM domain-containing protein